MTGNKKLAQLVDQITNLYEAGNEALNPGSPLPRISYSRHCDFIIGVKQFPMTRAFIIFPVYH
jgi:hypothetical protein